MKKRFNYLQHENAVREILKHKWIESKKAKRDIGFATAALDWITKYGKAWKQYQGIDNQHNSKNIDVLAERRRYRRFKTRFYARVKIKDAALSVHIEELSHCGIQFFTDQTLGLGSYIEIFPDLNTEGQSCVCFKATVARIQTSHQKQKNKYLITALFDKDTQGIIINHKRDFLN